MLVFIGLVLISSSLAENVRLKAGEVYKVSTPGYPRPQEDRNNLKWDFSTAPDAKILVDCDDFRVRSDNCKNLQLTFNDGSKTESHCEPKVQADQRPEPIYFISGGSTLSVDLKYEGYQLVSCSVRSTEDPEPEDIVITPEADQYEIEATEAAPYFDHLWRFKSSTGEKLVMECSTSYKDSTSCYVERFEFDNGAEKTIRCNPDRFTVTSKDDTIKFRAVFDRFGQSYYQCKITFDRPAFVEPPRRPTPPPMKISQKNVEIKTGQVVDITTVGYYTDEDSANTEITYDISVSPGAHVQLHCPDFRMTTSKDSNCEWGDTTIDDGNEVHKFCTKSPRNLYVTSAKNKMKVTFRSISGWLVLCKARTTEEPTATQITLKPTDRVYRFNMPTEPKKFDDMVWAFKSVEGSKISLQCDLSFPPTEPCSKTVFTVDLGNEVKTFCGYQNIVEFSSGQSMKVRLQYNDYYYERFKCFAQAITGPNADEHLNMKSEERDSSEHGVAPGKVLTTCDCGRRNHAGGRIFHGKQTTEGEYTWMVGIRNQRNYQRCGGSLITRYHVLTAAHCMVDSDTRRRNETHMDTVVALGAYRLDEDAKHGKTQYINTRMIFIPDEYFSFQHNYDISVIFLEKPADFNKFVGPVCMAKVFPNILNKEIRLTGWGSTENQRASNVLLTTKLFVMDTELCNIEPWFVCTHKKHTDSCSGDSGSPLVHWDEDTNRYTQVSLVSFGYSYRCQVTGGGTTNVTWFYDWIEDKIKRTMPSEHMCTKVE